jgi:hypothetical protein
MRVSARHAASSETGVENARHNEKGVAEDHPATPFIL